MIDIKQGLNDEQVKQNRSRYGSNELTPPKRDPWYKLFFEKFKDPTIEILCVAAVLSLILGTIQGEFLEPIGIISAILLATFIGFWNEYSAGKKFDILNKVTDETLVRVRRNGEVVQVPRKDIVWNDIVILEAGEEVPADIEVIQTIDLKVNESVLTGESKSVKKWGKEEGPSASGTYPHYLSLKGTIVEEGSCTGRVINVGDATEFGKTARQASEISGVATPLSNQLDGLATLITKIAYWCAGILITSLLVKYFFIDVAYIGKDLITVVNELLAFIMIAVALIVVAVPEGLPMAVTLALSYSMKKMVKTNNLVRKMHACETLGATTIIFTDKTGTLTQNKMKVVNKEIITTDHLTLNIYVNSTANIGPNQEFIGNPTECALLLSSEGIEILDSLREQYEVHYREAFNSLNKYMLTIIRKDHKFITLIKGAPEVIREISLPTDESLWTYTEAMASKGNRTIAFAFKESDTIDEAKTLTGLTLNGVMGIEDPIRKDVPLAIDKCYDASVDVVMMTGDNLQTALEIGKQAGIGRMTEGEIWAVEAKDFKEEYVTSGKYPHVIARCKPEDKLRILKLYQNAGFVCAMTGDGTNDAPALNHAHVGIAMNNGTAVAKEASDIILLDNSFPSIVNGIKWGRSLYKNIQHFILFQLTINVAAILIACVGPFIGINFPLTVIQMLWINLIMDTFAALALATEPANDSVMKEQPRNPRDFIISKKMFKQIGIVGVFFFIMLVYFLIRKLDLTEFFTFFVLIQWWNLFFVRVYGQKRNIFDGLFKNPMFIGIALLILVGQFVIVQFGGDLFRTEPMNIGQWIYWGWYSLFITICANLAARILNR